MSRQARLLTLALSAALAPAPLLGQAAEPPRRIDLLIAQESESEAARRRECEARQDAASVASEIVVCGTRDDDAASAGWDREDWENRYAAATRGRDPVDPCGPMCGIFKGKPTVGGLCIPGLQKCPPPPALILDVAALPQAPPGSDADRIARGLAPRGGEAQTADGTPGSKDQGGSLGLPPPPGLAAGTAVSPAGSEEPAAPQ